jgi:hypothetical protein
VRRTLFLALLAAALAPACGGDASEPEAQEPAQAPETTTSAPTTTEAAPPPPPPPPPAPTPRPKPPPGTPAFVAGYRSWPKLNQAPIPPRDSDPHEGTKNVYASKRKRGDGRFPNGTIVVKEAARPGADFIGLIAVMRKRPGADPEHNDWVFVEFTREEESARFGETASGAVCWSCHVGAQESDYVFTAGG